MTWQELNAVLYDCQNNLNGKTETQCCSKNRRSQIAIPRVVFFAQTAININSIAFNFRERAGLAKSVNRYCFMQYCVALS